MSIDGNVHTVLWQDLVRVLIVSDSQLADLLRGSSVESSSGNMEHDGIDTANPDSGPNFSLFVDLDMLFHDGTVTRRLLSRQYQQIQRVLVFQY